MGYNYNVQRDKVFTEAGQLLFLAIRDKAKELTRTAGAARLAEIIRGQSGDSWDMLACVDRLVELGELREIPQVCAGQHRIFIRAREEAE